MRHGRRFVLLILMSVAACGSGPAASTDVEPGPDAGLADSAPLHDAEVAPADARDVAPSDATPQDVDAAAGSDTTDPGSIDDGIAPDQPDAGLDAGLDAAPDAAPDAPPDAATDAAPDAPHDAGNPDAGQVGETLGLAWAEAAPAHAPSPRASQAMAWDSARNVVVLYGGLAPGTPQVYFPTLDDTWEWDGTDWTERVPAHRPPACSDAGLAFDARRGVSVFFGGFCPGGSGDETWEWDGTDWTRRSPATIPPRRSNHGLAWDAGRQMTVLFSGVGSQLLDDTWVWDGTDWTLATPVHSPPGRFVEGMVWDATRAVVVLFAGCGSFPCQVADLTDTWEWDGTDWSERTPASHPSLRVGAALAYDSAREVTIVFGGNDSGTACATLADTWAWNGLDWTLLQQATAPMARKSARMAYDAARGAGVLFGGVTDSGAPGVSCEFRNDTWLLRHSP